MKIEGKILDAELASVVSDVIVTLQDREQHTICETTSDSDGNWRLDSHQDGSFLHFEAPGYVKKKIPTQDCPQILRLLEDQLIGYQDKLWFQPGEKINVYVHSSSSYKARLFRHGLEKKLILDFGKHDHLIQLIPDGFFVDNGLAWKTAFQYTLSQDIQSGLYSLLLSSSGEKNFAIPMLVSTPRKAYGAKAKILVLASTNNWQSYNTWGGRSRYRNFEEERSDDFIGTDKLKLHNRIKTAGARLLSFKMKQIIKSHVLKRHTENKKWQFDKLSVKRPFINCALEGETVFEPFTNHLAAGEWRVLAWLERENIEYDIISGYELHQNSDLLENYQGIIFSTHCEYWSQKMYAGVYKYHTNNGLWLINLSGNTMYREVDFFEDGSHRCVSLRFSESVADETQLLGVRYSMDDYATCSKFKIIDSSHWAFEGIPLNSQYPFFGGLSLNQNTPIQTRRYDPGRPGFLNGFRGQGASGWETDKRSKTAPSDMKCIAKGCNKRGGADMLVREPRGTRGGMFTASSIVFGGSLLIDNVSSMITKNIILKVLKGRE